MSTPAANTVSVRVWDLPTRLFHWVLVLLISLQYATGEYRVLDMRWHYWLGYVTLALLAFRVLWGLAGSQTSRFTDFLRGPVTVLRHFHVYVSTTPQSAIGHNPLGGWSVLAMIVCVQVQAVTGLFSSDEISDQGPFAEHVAEKTMRLMTRIHDWNQNLLLLLIALHVLAVLLHLLLKHDNLILPMINGRKTLAVVPRLRFVSAWWALLFFVLCVAAVATLVRCAS